MTVSPPSQGRHIDPADVAVDSSHWHPDRTAAFESPEMQTYRSALTINGLDVRTSVLEELAEYHGYPPEECLNRCLHWEQWSVREWTAGNRSTPEGVQDFYNSVQSWAFDLSWYAYLQTVGHGYPAAVIAARFADKKAQGRDYLDFGAGTGTTAQLFARRGYCTSMADVAAPLLKFAAWRMARHGDHVTQVDLTTDALPTKAYDFITALDTLVHVTDSDATVRDLHRAIRPGGYLLANFDVRADDGHGSLWHLHNDLHSIDHRLRATGFVRTHTLGGITGCYLAVDPTRRWFRATTAVRAATLPVRRTWDRAHWATRKIRTKLQP